MFAIYKEDLIDEIENTDEGVSIGNIKIIVYAGDIVLLSDSIIGLNRLLTVTENYGKKWEIKFNPSKTMYMAFGGVKDNGQKPIFDGIEIERVKVVKCLGIWINDKLTNINHQTNRKKGTMARLKAPEDVLGTSNLPPYIKTFLYQSFARPVLYYGLEPIMMNLTERRDVQTLESTIIKHMVGLSKYSKSTELLYAVDMEKTELFLNKSKCSFFIRLLENDYTKKVVDEIENFYSVHKDEKKIYGKRGERNNWLYK